MNIAIGARTLKENPGDGIAWFTCEVIQRMVRDHPADRFFLITDKKYVSKPVTGDNVEYIRRGPRNRHPLITYFWHQFVIPPVLGRIKADIFIGPDGIIPLDSNIPCIPVIHDLNHFHRPKDIPAFTRGFYNYFFPKYAFQAKRIATVSEYSAADISKTYGIERGLIDVVYNGVAEVFSPASDKEKEETRNDVTGGSPYFLFVSNFSPRKNVVTLVKAFERYCKETDNTHKLVLAGGRLYLNSDLDKAVKSSVYKDSVVFTGNVSRERLRLLYGSAEAFVFVPWFEGFGIPVVEAMRCGVPCIISDNSSLPEVSGGAGLCVNASDDGAVAEAMARIVREPGLRLQLKEEGLKNSMRFSWDNSAVHMWNCIVKAMAKNA